MAETGNPVVEFSKENLIVVRKPYSQTLIKIDDDEEIKITDDFIPLIQFNLQQGSEVVLLGALKLKADLPKQCFSVFYEKGKDQKMDYYTCKDCKFNWICKPCAESCHKGHTITEYIMAHQPTWACCYCVKNKKCQIVNQKS